MRKLPFGEMEKRDGGVFTLLTSRQVNLNTSPNRVGPFSFSDSKPHRLLIVLSRFCLPFLEMAAAYSAPSRICRPAVKGVTEVNRHVATFVQCYPGSEYKMNLRHEY